MEQLTNDPVNKYAGFMFQAPDFDDSYIFFTLADHTAIQVFEQTGFNPDGSPAFTLVNTITSPALSPKTPMFNILVTANSLPARQRLDPVITPNGPYLYYNRIVPLQSGQTKYFNEGEWYIDMQLGVPTGSCVGSSAEDGLVNGC